MKTMIPLALLASAALAAGQEEAPAPTLKPGDAVTPDALATADWIQGAAPEKWEDGKLYVLECWATWCGPCVAAIPHVNELYKKYSEKGLRVLGMNVWEDGKDKVAKFVEQKGDGMSYPVAYTGRGSVFENSWLKAAGVRGIPHAFVVKDGKLLFSTHPMQLTDEMVEGLLAGGEAQQAALDKVNKASAMREQRGAALNKYREAMQAEDGDAMAAAIKELEEMDPEAPFLPQMRLDLAIVNKDWDAAAAQLDAIAGSAGAEQVLGSLAFRCDREPELLPEPVRASVAKNFGKALETTGNPTGYVLLSRLQWSLGDKESAMATAKTSVEKAGEMPAGPFERFVKTVEDGEPATASEVFGWLREEMMKQRQQEQQ